MEIYWISAFNVFVALLFPILVLVYLFLKKRQYLPAFGMGILCFLILEGAMRRPLFNLLFVFSAFTNWVEANPILYALLFGVSAALFQEGGRWISMRYLLKSSRTLGAGISYGLGFGGMEAAMVLGINSLFAPFMVPEELAAVSLQELFLGGVERVSYLVLQVAFSLLVMQAVRRRKRLYLAAAFCLHALVDTVATWMQAASISILFTQLVLLAFALIALVYIIIACRKEPKSTPQEVSAV